MRNFSTFSIAFLAFCAVCFSQQPVSLGEVVIVADKKLKEFSNTQQTLEIPDSTITRNQPSLTDLLNANSSIYFKENGAGMVSSPSFRGTTAQQTAVLWNGININSQLNGQTDFNTINTRVFDAITVRSGGGSVLYGSGAIGGTIHLINELDFEPGFKDELFLNYGSFNTYGVNNKFRVSSEKFTTHVAINRTASDNDYEILGRDRTNLNGQFYNHSLSANFGWKLNAKNTLKFYSYLFEGERHFSLIFPSEIPTKYHDFNTRNLLEWTGGYGKFTSTLKLAHLTEAYQYYPNIEREGYSSANVKSVVAKYDLGYKINGRMQLNGILSFNQNRWEGSDIEKETRNIAAFNLLFKHWLGNKFLYEITARKEATDNYESPFLYSVGAKFDATHFYTLSVNTSKNFRIPTFNDLYWQGSGNPDLKPETSNQAEVGNTFYFKNLEAAVTAYYISIRDMIRWVPQGSVWRPVNTEKVESYGLESKIGWKKQFNQHQFSFNGSYAYTVSEDEKTGNQLIYVPFHKGSASAGYGFKNVSAYYQFIYVGEVFTRSDNDAQYNLEGYNLSNLGVEYSFGKNSKYTFGAQARNIFNRKYESVASRPMPGRNYNFYINLNF